MIKVRPYQRGDVLHVKATELFTPGPFMEKMVEGRAMSTSSVAFTIVKNGKIIGCTGLFFYWPGMAECWGYYSDELYKHPVFMVKHARRILRFYRETLCVVRYQATIQAGHEVLHRWMRALGFQVEGHMPKYGPEGADYYMYGKVF